MALGHSLLAALVHGPASGYDLSKLFDSGMSDFWRASSQQIYAELRKLDEQGLIEGEVSKRENRPQRRVYELTEAGRRKLHEFTSAAPRPPVVRDEMMVKLYAIDAADVAATVEDLRTRAASSDSRVTELRQLATAMRADRSHEEYLLGGAPLGPYLTCLLGIGHHAESAQVCRWIADVLTARADGAEHPPGDPIDFVA